MEKKVLISARDAGGALSVLPVIRALESDPRFEVAIVASGVASTLFEREGLIVDNVLLGGFDSIDAAHDLIVVAKELISTHRPDAILTGLSGPTAGIDEALIVSASEDIPTFSVQDYWGDVNLTFGKGADHYFVIDDLAETITKLQVANSGVSKVGSVKHTSYHSIDPNVLKGFFRCANGIEEDAFLVCLIGQPLWHLKGYEQTMQFALSEITNIPGAVAVYLPHPAEPEIAELPEWLPCVEPSKQILEVVVDSDVLCAVNSSVIADAAAYAAATEHLFAVGAYMLWDVEISQWVEETTGMDFVPLARSGCAITVQSQEEFSALLMSTRQEAHRERVFSAIKENKLCVPGAELRILDVVWSKLATLIEHEDK